MNNHTKIFAHFNLLILVILSLNAYPFSRFTNYVSPRTINTICTDSKTTWIASSGGIFSIDKSTKKQTLFSSSESFPDLNILSIVSDGNFGVWAGTQHGYLFHISASGTVSTFDWYHSSQWDISSLTLHNQYLIIGSSKGLSVFSTATYTPVQSATSFVDFSTTKTNATAIFNDTLFVAMTEGVLSLPVKGKKLTTFNLYDRNIWNIVDKSGEFKSFTLQNNVLTWNRTIACVYKNKLLTASGTEISSADGSLHTFASSITSLFAMSDSILYIGTQDNYYYSWDLVTEPHNLTLPGPITQYITKIKLDHSGNLWALTQNSSASGSEPWWMGIQSFDGDTTWRIFTRTGTPGFGSMGSESHPSVAVCNDRSNNMWFGCGSANIKKFDPAGPFWLRYGVSGKGFNGKFIGFDDSNDPGWGMCNAIAQDSSGYIWIGSWNNYAGCLICYDSKGVNPTSTDYKRFLGNGEAYLIDGISYTVPSSNGFLISTTAINVDSKGVILAGSDNGKLVVISHSGNPLSQGISLDFVFDDLQSISKIVSIRNTSYIASGKGLYSYNSTSKKRTKSESIQEPIVSLTPVILDSTLWLGTANNGLIHYNPTNDSILLIINETSGLLNNDIHDLEIDEKRGFLWIASASGLSKYYLGQSLSPLATNSLAKVFPNPYKLSRHKNQNITFQNILPNSRVLVYTSSGMLIGEATPLPLIKEQNEWTFSFKPQSSLLVGSYIYSIKNNKNSKYGKIIIAP